MSKKVLVIGELNIDMILNHIKGFPEMSKEKIADELDVTLGSSSAIFAANLSALGTDVSYLGMVGKDDFGDFIVRTLTEKNVVTDQILRSPSLKTGITVVMNYGMDRAMVTYPGAMEELSMSHLSKENISAFDHVHISSVFLQPNIKKDIVPIFKMIKDLGLTTSLDPQWDPSENWDLDLKSLLEYVDIFLPNKKEFLALTKVDTLEEGLSQLDNFLDKIVIKDGEFGAHKYINGVLETKPSFLNNDVVDCIGAGDSFDAGYVHRFINDHDALACLEFANIVGAINTTNSGGTKAFETKEGILKTALEKFDYSIEL
ncbi:carbohydrate kinase family protein [Portibacter lacus]|uniref:Ribokinase n=1 Tax=Portibacter lacus TaxID=1099794 RepID=A0AA37SPQ0_9BACT|nr:sugar kinase [Portibacter lacus]GLR17584.1 ribokinase [Portibacter lacus]